MYFFTLTNREATFVPIIGQTIFPELSDLNTLLSGNVVGVLELWRLKIAGFRLSIFSGDWEKRNSQRARGIYFARGTGYLNQLLHLCY